MNVSKRLLLDALHALEDEMHHRTPGSECKACDVTGRLAQALRLPIEEVEEIEIRGMLGGRLAVIRGQTAVVDLGRRKKP